VAPLNRASGSSGTPYKTLKNILETLLGSLLRFFYEIMGGAPSAQADFPGHSELS
jgi:hypothetical protein